MNAALGVTDIGDEHQSNVAESDTTIRHYPSVTDGDKVNIQLNLKNSCICTFPNRQKGIVLWDSGATFSLISEGAIADNPYLMSIPQVSIPTTNFLVGNGGQVVTNKSLTFAININNNVFEITAHIIPTIGGISVIIGTKSMKELEMDLSFKRNIIKFRTKDIYARIARNVNVNPGDTKILTMRGNLPHILKSAEVYFQPNRFLSQYVPALMLVQFHKGITRIAVHNSSNKVLKIRRDKPIGTFLLQNFGSVPSNELLRYSEDLEKPQDLVLPVSAVRNATEEPNRKTLMAEKLKKFPFLDKDDARLTMTDEEILRKDIDLSGHCMSPGTLKKFWKILLNRKNAFSIHGEVGECPDLSVKLKLNDESPFFIRPYPVSELEKEVIDKEMEKLVKMGILTYGKSSYVSPILLLKKKNNPSNPYRLVSDFRVLNTKVVPLHYCTPLLRDALQSIGNSNATVFSTIDIKNAFYSLKVHPDSRKYLTIAPYQSGRTLQYKRLPQGLSISPTEWADKIETIMSELPNHNQYSLAIADDIIIYSENESTHLKHLESLLSLFEKHGLKLSVNKCQFFRQCLDYMGHKVQITDNRPSVTPQKSKVDAIDKLKPPKTPKETKSLIGMVAYLSMYIPKLQILLTPMHKLTRKGVKFEWTKEMEDNFSEIKAALKEYPVLTLPAKEGLIRIYCDTSVVGTGACICQVQNGKEIILGFYSRKLPESARRYTISELEGTGMLMCVQAYRYLLRSVPFEIITDHSALMHISRSKQEPPTLRLKKIFERLSAFKFTLKYKKGKEMVISDFFSRYPTCEVDDNDPIAFLYEEPKQQCDDIAQDHQDCDEDARLLVTTRSKVKSTGEELLQGLPTFSRGRCGDLPPTMAKTPTKAVSPKTQRKAGNNRQVITPIKPTTSDSTVTRYSPISNNSPRWNHQDPLGMDVRASQPRLVTQDSTPTPPIPPRFDTLLPPKEDTMELPTRLTDLATKIDRERDFSFREKLITEAQPPVETHTNPEPYMLKRPERLIDEDEDIDIFHRSIPKQKDVTRMLSTLSKKFITDHHLPVTKATLAKQQTADPYLRPIYNYLKHNHLPAKGRAQKNLIAQAEGFALVNDLLFRMQINEKAQNDSEMLSFSLCIPEVLEPMIFHMEHESIYSNHMGITKTYLTMRKRYFIKNLFDKLTNYIKSCHQCQTIKAPTDVERPYEMRIPTAYRPFQRLFADIKYMPMSASGNSFLLVIACEITRYCYAIPMKRTNAQNVAEVLLKKIVLVHGEPENIVTDEDRGFNNQVTDFLWNAVRTKVTTCSPYNHGSLAVERHIKSISSLICANLKDNGRNWDTFVEAATYSYNTHIIPRLGYSPYYLVYLRQPSPLTELKFSPLEDIKSDFREYVKTLQRTLEHVGKSMLDIQARLQSQQAAKHMEKVKQPNKYKEGLIVYLNAPSASSLKTNTLKFKSDYVGPLWIKELLGNDKTILATLDGKILHGVFHVNRLKPGFIRLQNGSASHIDEVRTAYTKAQIQKLDKTPATDLKSAEAQAETKTATEPHTAAACNIQEFLSLQQKEPYQNMPTDCISTETPQQASIDKNMCMELADQNRGLAAPHILTHRQAEIIKSHGNKLPQQGEDMTVTKIRCKHGKTQLCLQGESSGPGYAFWYEPSVHPKYDIIIRDYLQHSKEERNRIRTHGNFDYTGNDSFLE